MSGPIFLIVLAYTGSITATRHTEYRITTHGCSSAPANEKAFICAGDHLFIEACLASEHGLPEMIETEKIRHLRWFLLKPLAKNYDNTNTPTLTALSYQWLELPELKGRAKFELSEVAELTREGSHRLAVFDASPYASPRTLPPSAVDRLFEIVIRRNDSYIGYLTELFGTPFVLWPRSTPQALHQTDARLGADCVALVIYGRRRLGEKIPYVSPTRLKGFLSFIGHCKSVDQPCMLDKPIQLGDILHFGFQTAVLSGDTPPLGALNGTDLAIHTYHKVAEEIRIDSLPYRHHKLEVLRWPTEVTTRHGE